MKFMIIENDIDLISHYDSLGVDRIFLDLELLGKQERQGHLNTVISHHHEFDDIAKIKKVLKNSELLVRINPIHENTSKEIERCIKDEADIIMLPMFKTSNEVEYFIGQVAGRKKTCLLLETSQAMCRLDEILTIDGIDEIHIGLNDLHLAFGLDFMFELLTSGIVEYIANKIKNKGIPFGFGGVATCKGGVVPGELVLSEHVRLNSEMVILSRAFKNIANDSIAKFSNEFQQLRMMHNYLSSAPLDTLIQNQMQLKSSVQNVVQQKNVSLQCFTVASLKE